MAYRGCSMYCLYWKHRACRSDCKRRNCEVQARNGSEDAHGGPFAANSIHALRFQGN